MLAWAASSLGVPMGVQSPLEPAKLKFSRKVSPHLHKLDAEISPIDVDGEQDYDDDADEEHSADKSTSNSDDDDDDDGALGSDANSSSAIGNAAAITAAFEGEGLLFHHGFRAIRSTKAIRELAWWSPLADPNHDFEKHTFQVETDAGPTSAWSLLRQDLPFAPFLDTSYMQDNGGLAVGFIADVRSFKETNIVSMTPVDADTNMRDCTDLQDMASRRVRAGSASRQPYQEPCASGDKACRAYFSWTCACRNRVFSSARDSALSCFCTDRCLHQRQSNSDCGICYGTVPYWCRTSSFPNVSSATDWMARFGNSSSIGSVQCKFPPEQWATFTDTIKLLHHTRQTLPPADPRSQTTWHPWNEVNLVFDADGGTADALWEKSILGIYYVDLEAVGPARGEWRLDGTDQQSREATHSGKKVALELVQKYNQRNAPKRINLFRIIRAEDGAVRYWRNGAQLNLTEYMQDVPY